MRPRGEDRSAAGPFLGYVGRGLRRVEKCRLSLASTSRRPSEGEGKPNGVGRAGHRRSAPTRARYWECDPVRHVVHDRAEQVCDVLAPWKRRRKQSCCLCRDCLTNQPSLWSGAWCVGWHTVIPSGLRRQQWDTTSLARRPRMGAQWSKKGEREQPDQPGLTGTCHHCNLKGGPRPARSKSSVPVRQRQKSTHGALVMWFPASLSGG